MTTTRFSRFAHRFGWGAFRRLSPLQRITVLALLALVAALLLAGVRTVWLSIGLMIARDRGPAESCPTLSGMTDPEEISIVSDGLTGYSCEASAAGGFATESGTVDTMLLLFGTVLLAVAGIITLLGVLVAVTVRGLLRLVIGRPRRSLGAWGIGLITAACLLLPWTYLFLYFGWYSASNSSGGSLCPSTVSGEYVSSLSVGWSFLPPHLTCSGETVDGTEFETSQFGFPFGLFLTAVVLAVIGLGLLIAARVIPGSPTAHEITMTTA